MLDIAIFLKNTYLDLKRFTSVIYSVPKFKLVGYEFPNKLEIDFLLGKYYFDSEDWHFFFCFFNDCMNY